MNAHAPVVAGTRVHLRVDIDGDASTHGLQWSLPREHVPDAADAADAAVPATLLIAMARREDLTLDAPVSARLADNIDTIQSVFESWARQSEVRHDLPPVFRPVTVTRTERPADAAPPPTERRSACFFSGGVDSLATAISHADEEPTLVYVHGLDIPLADTERRSTMSGEVRRAAAGLGLPLLEVETNLREVSNVYVDWMDAHGAALATVALLLGRWFERVYVPASATYATLLPLGSHPLLDPLWSSERVEIVHDGCEWTRLDKLEIVDRVPIARETLRVCVSDDHAELNCGRCWKCILTIAGVRALGIDDRFPTLPRLTDAEYARRVVSTPTIGSRMPSLERQQANWVPYVAAAGPDEARLLKRALAVRYIYAVGRYSVRRARDGVRRSTERAMQRAGQEPT